MINPILRNGERSRFKVVPDRQFFPARKLRPALLFLLLQGFLTQCDNGKLTVSEVYCNNRVDPAGVEASELRFSWKLESGERNVLQTSYRLILCDGTSGSVSVKDKIWDSGIIQSDRSILVPFDGPQLKPGTRYVWKVKVRDNHGNESRWSPEGSFITALFNQSDWQGARWIGYSRFDSLDRVVPGIHLPVYRPDWRDRITADHVLPVLRREFNLEEKPVRAILFISAPGHYELSLNGKKLGDRFLAPGWTRYDRQCLYNVYDITGQPGMGENCLGVMLGNGFWSVPNTRYRKLITDYGSPRMILLLKLVYKDGRTEQMVSNDRWRTAPGPLTYSSIYGGENYDARLEMPGWDRPGFDDSGGETPELADSGREYSEHVEHEPDKPLSEDFGNPIEGWQDALELDAPSGELAVESDYPVKVENILEPVSVHQVLHSSSTRGDYLYDFGQNASGIVEIEVSGNRGDTVKLVPAELINEDYSPDQRASGRPYYWMYVLKGDGTETWRPKFTYYGFRYVRVQGAVPEYKEGQEGADLQERSARELPRILALRMLHTRNSTPASGEFHTSLELFNRIDSLILWAIRSNMQSVLSDCPHREKLGWLEQAYLMGEGIHSNYDIYQLYSKVIRDMIQSQTPQGLVPAIAPEFVLFRGGFRDSPEWGSAAVILPWQMYRWYGDTNRLAESWDMMERYMEYLEGKSTDHILSHGLGDWYDLGPNLPGNAQLTPVALTATATWYYDLVLVSKTATVLGMEDQSRIYAARAEEVRKAFNREFYDPQTGTYATGSQTAMSMPLVLGLVDGPGEEMRPDRQEENRSGSQVENRSGSQVENRSGSQVENKSGSQVENRIGSKSKRDRILSNLKDSIRAGGYVLTAGDIGYHYLVRALQDAGEGEILFKMNAREDVPGYGYQLKKGATTLTESWSAQRRVSNNHLMLGHLMEWFYAGLAGIRQTDSSLAFGEVLIDPQIVGGIQSASAEFESPYGRIISSWQQDPDEIRMEIQIPVNSRAVIHFPSGNLTDIKEGDKSLNQVQGLKILPAAKGHPEISIGSGHYNFNIKSGEPVQLKPDKTLIYKKIGRTKLSLHIFNPEGLKPGDRRPAIVFFFGGGWNNGTPAQFYPQCDYLASRGMVAISAEYRVKSRNLTTPRECVMDGKSAVRWIRKHAIELGVDPDRIAAGGGSAGGHVAAATGSVSGFEEDGEDLSISSCPNALILFNPVFDNSPEGYGYDRVREYWKEISPMHNINKNTPPTIIFLGTRECISFSSGPLRMAIQ